MHRFVARKISPCSNWGYDAPDCALGRFSVVASSESSQGHGCSSLQGSGDGRHGGELGNAADVPIRLEATVDSTTGPQRLGMPNGAPCSGPARSSATFQVCRTCESREKLLGGGVRTAKLLKE
jgi:hypothetical protein